MRLSLLLALLLRAAAVRARFAVSDVFLAEAESPQNALDLCQLNPHGQSVGVDWGNANAGRVLQLCVNREPVQNLSSTHVVQRIAVYASGAKPACLATETELYRPRDGVVVCVRRVAVDTGVLASGNFLSDVWVSENRNYNSDLPGWHGIATNVIEPADSLLRRWWQWLWWPSYRGAFVTYQRPLVPIREVKLVTVPKDWTADACISKLGFAWELASLTALDADDGDNSKAVLCIRRGDTEMSDRVAASLASVSVIDGEATTKCEGPEGETTRIALPSSKRSLCLHWSDSTTSGAVLNNLLFASSLQDKLRGQFERVSQLDLNEKGSKKIHLYSQSTWKPVELINEAPEEDGLSNKPPLAAKVVTEGLSFKILQLADLHYSGDPSTSCNDVPTGMRSRDCSEALMTKFVNELLDLEKPDFVAFTGDNVQVYSKSLRQAAIDIVVKGVEERGIPYAVIFGNHDDQRGFSRQQMMKMYVQKRHVYARRGPVNIDGVGNYEISIKAPQAGAWGAKGSDVFRMYFIDSHAYPDSKKTPHYSTTYDWIKPSQVSYYRQLSQAHVADGTSVPAIMFFHIPLPEYAMDARAFRTAGDHVEGVASSAVNMNLFASLVELGEVKATFCGHDHVNDYCYKRDGVHLCYGGGIGFGTAYGLSDVKRRARVIEWSVDSQNRKTIRSWRRLFGETERKQLEEVIYSEDKPTALPTQPTADAV